MSDNESLNSNDSEDLNNYVRKNEKGNNPNIICKYGVNCRNLRNGTCNRKHINDNHNKLLNRSFEGSSVDKFNFLQELYSKLLLENQELKQENKKLNKIITSNLLKIIEKMENSSSDSNIDNKLDVSSYEENINNVKSVPIKLNIRKKK